MKLTRETMLSRMLAADPAFDGRFITGVISTGIYCLPSCRARKPKPQNVEFYPTPDLARAAGLRPCLRCKPDDFYAGHHGEDELFKRLCELPLAELPNVRVLAEIAEVSPRHLQDLFWRQRQQTPAEWLNQKRVRKSQKLLLKTDKSVTEIAFEVGYASLSTFGTQFHRRVGMTPAAFRRLSAGAGSTLAMPPDYPLEVMLAQLGRDLTATTQRVTGNQLSLALKLSGGARVITVELIPGQALVHPTGSLAPEDTLRLWEVLWQVLGLGQTSLDTARNPTGKQFNGLRLCLTPNPWDALVWAVIGQQVTFKAACTFRARLARILGNSVQGGLYYPPEPAQILALSEEEWSQVGLTRQRVDTLQQLATLVREGPLGLEDRASVSVPQLERTLRNVTGFGPWSLAYFFLRGLGLPDIVPLGDSALATALQRYFQLPSRPTPAEVDRLMAPFAPQRSLATLQFWHTLQGVSNE